MAKKLLLVASVLLVLAGVGIAVLVTVNRDMAGYAGADDERSLRASLEMEFGGPARVEFTCILPVVGVAPCILDTGRGSREVTLTFSGHESPVGITPEERALRIATRSYAASEFVQTADRTHVIFEEITDGDFSSLSRTSQYSFGGPELAAAVAGGPPLQDPDPADESPGE